MDALLHERRIRLWELLCSHYTVPKSRQVTLDKIIRSGEEIPPYRAHGKSVAATAAAKG